MPIKLCLVVGNDEHILVCNFGGRIMSGLKVVGGAPEPLALPPGRRMQNSVIDPNLPAASECPHQDKGLFNKTCFHDQFTEAWLKGSYRDTTCYLQQDLSYRNLA